MYLGTLGDRVFCQTEPDERARRRLRLCSFACWTLLLWNTACNDEPAREPVAIDVRAESLQLAYLSPFKGTSVVTGSAANVDMARSTAVVKGENPQPTVPFGSCGATFVSPHFALTAAHCVPQMPINGVSNTFFLQEVSLGNLSAAELSSYLTITGTWKQGPGWSHATLTQGYNTVEHRQCRVTRRCSREHGHENCPLGNSGVDVDMALILCPERSSLYFAITPDILERAGIPADLFDQPGLDLNIWWFHELYNLPTEPNQPGFSTDRWEHYGLLEKGREFDNWHYLVPHQVLPLVSFQHPSGSPIKITAPSRFLEEEMEMNAPACHGTSGSGVFLSGTKVFLGPAVHNTPDADIFGRLCDRFDSNQDPQLGRSTYIRARTTADFLRNAPEVAHDLGL